MRITVVKTYRYVNNYVRKFKNGISDKFMHFGFGVLIIRESTVPIII